VSSGWEDRAASWIAWARKPSHDAYAHFRDAFFSILPPPAGPTLEVGCGEGRVCRDLRSHGYDVVVGLDASPSLVAAAKEADPAGEYVVGVAEALPFDEASFGLVASYNSLMDVDDVAASVREISRVLVDGGRFCACVTHPVRARGGWETRESGDVYVMEHSYFEARRYRFEAARDGLEFTFESRTYSLADYASALESAGFVIESLREPEGRDAHDRFLPEFLLWRALKP
jgi:SAM-dependent methyltransferase